MRHRSSGPPPKQRLGSIVHSGTTLAALLVLFVAALVVVPAPAVASPPLVIGGANTLLDHACEKSVEAPLASGDYLNQTEAANDPDGGYADSIILGNDASDTGSDNVTFGMRSTFSGIRIKIDTAGVSGTVTWRYWSGTEQEWRPLSLTFDGTDKFRKAGTNTVSWTPPSDWAKRTWTHCQETRQMYFVQVVAGADYTVQPLGSHFGAITHNLLVRVMDELGNPLTGLDKDDFQVAAGTDLEIFDLREVLPGQYKFALDTKGADVDFEIIAKPVGYVQTGVLDTGILSSLLRDRTTSPLVADFAVKVSVMDRDSAPVTGAVVALGGSAPTAHPAGSSDYYFVGTIAGALTVTAADHEALARTVDTQTSNLVPGLLDQTHVILSGADPCDVGTEVAAGVTVTCRGLLSLLDPSTSTSDPGSTSSPGDDETTSPSVPCADPVQPVNGLFTSLVARATADAVLRVCLDASKAMGLERVDVVLGQAGDAVEVQVEPVAAIKAEWTAIGVTEPPSEARYGFARINIKFSGADWDGSAAATSIRFRIAKADLEAAGLEAKDVRLLRWNGHEWTNVPTDVKGDLGNYVAFSAAGPGHGIFAITGEPAQPDTGLPWWVWLIGGLLVVGLIVGGSFMFVKPGGRKPSQRYGPPPGSSGPGSSGPGGSPPSGSIPNIRAPFLR